MGDSVDALIDAMEPGHHTPPAAPATEPPGDEMPTQARKDGRKKKEPKVVEVDDNGAPAHSEIAISSVFAGRAAVHYRFSPGLSWMRYSGHMWERDDKLLRYRLAKDIVTECSGSAGNAGDAKRIASAKTVAAVLSLAQSEAGIMVGAEAWDRDPMVLNTPKGIVQLETGLLRYRQPATDLITQAALVTPDASMQCPTWHRFLEGVFLGDRALIEFMRRSLGYMLTGSRREQVLFFWYGLGANGKSVLADTVRWIMGSYALKLTATALMHNRSERHPTELAQLRGKRLAISSELEESSFFNESLVKELTGDETLSARFMRQDCFEFVMQQKHTIVGNYKPRLRGGDAAMARRMLLVPFNATFKGPERDPLLLEKLKTEAPAILAWMVQGAVDWHRDGLMVPDSVRGASAEYMSDHDDLALWIEECCERSGEARAGDLYSSFARWKKARGEQAPSQTAWGSRLTTLAGIEKRRSNGSRYAGIRLTEREQLFLTSVGP